MFKLIAAMLVSCGEAGNGEEQTDPKNTEEVMEVEALPKNRQYNILFVGNSYTYTNDMPTAYFEKMAESCGYNVTVTAVTKGGYRLSKMADPSDPYGERVNAYLSGAGAFDYVILQEQSVLPTTNPEAFYASVENLAERIRNIGAQPMLYATWGRKDGSDTLTTHGMTNESMTWKLAAAYEHIGNALDIPVIHVGLAFRDVYSNSVVELYNPDLSHPAAQGSYLAAMSLFSGIFKVLPKDVSFDGSFSAQETAIMRKAAEAAVFRTPEIPLAYQNAAAEKKKD